MKLVIIGGNSGTGALLAELAHNAGHDVRVVSRSGSTTANPGIEQFRGDASNPEVVAAAISDADAVIVTVGGSKGVKHARSQTTQAVIQAMKSTGVDRLLVQSSLGAGDSTAQLPGAIGFITKLLLAQPLADHTQQEELVRSSGLEWNIVRPTGLNNKPPQGSWTALEVDEPGRLNGTISRHDLAAFMLELVMQRHTTGAAFGVSSS